MGSVVALIMGRAGSVGVPDKNIRMVFGQPLVAYPLRAALASGRVDYVFVSTDSKQIMDIAGSLGAKVIDRPEHLSGATSEMSDVIVHAHENISFRGIKNEIMVTMHANCATHPPGLIDRCVDKLRADPTLDSCVSARVVADLHPYRQKRVTEADRLENWVEVPQTIANNRQAISQTSVVLDGACRAFRPDRCLPPNGQPPFRYLGEQIGWIENPGGLDVHSEADIYLTEQWLRENRVEQMVIEGMA